MLGHIGSISCAVQLRPVDQRCIVLRPVRQAGVSRLGTTVNRPRGLPYPVILQFPPLDEP